ncbi:unnamed protein product [Calicophoron daubneyi]|uniref:Uncharacterized protein n=1 Tax=Calicophoron daubneyi TaxID=300641 RepID=A0AAV2TMI7_CALDB
MSNFSPYDPMTSGYRNGTTNGYGSNHVDTLNRMVVDGNYIDGSWELSVYVDDIGSDVKVRVLGELTLGGLMHRIVENVDLQQSWSDHAIWWVDRNVWLLHNRTTLDQYGIQSDAKLMFRRVHGDLQVILPSLAPVILRVSYAARVFSVVRSICQELNIRHPEELSLSFPITRAHLKSNRPLVTIRHGAKRTSVANSNDAMTKAKLATVIGPPYSPAGDGVPNSPYGTLHSATGTMMRLQSENSLDRDRLDSARYADCTFRRPAKTVFGDELLLKPKNLIQKARLNSGWLDSSRSLLEHGIEPPGAPQNTDAPVTPPILYLTFKFYSFYDLNPKYDAVRIHQLYEQARWSILSGQLECTEDEMVVFAAYQLQAELQSTAANQASYSMGLGDNVPPSHYATLGTIGTLGRPYVPHYGSLSGVKPSPEMSRRQLASPGFQYYGTGRNIGGGSLTRLPGSSSLIASANVVDGAGVSQTPNFSSRNGAGAGGAYDEVDELLAELEQSCGVAEEPSSAPFRSAQNNSTLASGGTLRSGIHAYDVPDTSEIPSLQDSLRVFKDRSRFLRRYKVYWVVNREAHLYLYKSKEEISHPLFVYSLRDCSVTPDVSTATQKYILKLSVLIDSVSIPDNDGTNALVGTPYPSPAIPHQRATREEVWLRFDSAEQYARWLAACRLGSRGKTLASRVAYEKEVDTILGILRLQVPGPTPAISASESVKFLGDLTDFCAERIIRKVRSKDYLRQRITEAHVNIRDVSLLDAKYKYIQAWQRLTNFGRSYFTVLFDRGSSIGINATSGGFFSSPTDQLVAICQGRFEIISPQSGDVIRAWNFSDLRSWNVNWDAGKVILDFRSGQLSFRPLCTNCKTIVEFIGGYVFLSQRNPEKSQECNERLFHRLTCATD